MSNESTSLRHWLYLVLYGCEVSAFCAVGAAYGLRVRMAQGNGFAFHGFPCGRWKQTGIQRFAAWRRSRNVC